MLSGLNYPLGEFKDSSLNFEVEFILGLIYPWMLSVLISTKCVDTVEDLVVLMAP